MDNTTQTESSGTVSLVAKVDTAPLDGLTAKAKKLRKLLRQSRALIRKISKETVKLEIEIEL